MAYLFWLTRAGSIWRMQWISDSVLDCKGFSGCATPDAGEMHCTPREVRMAYRSWSAFLFLLALLLTTHRTFAQETTSGSLRGRVVDAQGLVVPGATVSVSSGQGTRTYLTDAEGRFFAPYLTPGAYVVRVDLQGFRPTEQRNVELRLGQRLELAIVMRVGDLKEEVDVVGSPAVVDTTSTTAGTTLRSEVLNRVPVGRRFTDALYIAPGVTSGGGTGTANASIGGGSGLENNYIIDGVNISDAGYGAAGSYSNTFKTLGNAITFDFVQEIQVKTAGFEAEFGQSTGGSVNVITKSGTNRFRGSVFGYVRPDGLESSWKQLKSANGTVNTTGTSVKEVGFAVGGPIVRNRLFFFAAFNPQYERATLVAPPGFPLASLGEVPQDRRILSYSGKLTYQVSNGHRFDVSLFGDPSHGDEGPQRSSSLTGRDTGGFSELKEYGGNNQTIRYSGVLAPQWFVEASFARATSSLAEVPSVDEWAATDTTVIPNVRTGGVGKYEVNDPGKRLQYQAKSTYILGKHNIRAGGLWEDITYLSAIGVTGPTITLPNGQQTVTGVVYSVIPDPVYSKVYRVTTGYTKNNLFSTQKYLAAFAQDTFQVTSRLTIRPGVRWEEQQLVGVGSSYTFTGSWSPRVGVTYDPTGKGRAKIYANFGRFYTQYPNDLATRGFSALSAINTADYFDPQLTKPVPDGLLAGNTLNHFIRGGVNPPKALPGTKNTYNDEWLVGGEYEWRPGLNLSLRYTHRNLHNVIEDTAPAATVLFDLGIVKSVVFTIANPRDGYPSTAPYNVGAHETFIRQYDAVEFAADKRLSNKWSLQASYRWSRLYGDYEGFFRNDNNQSDPGLTSLADRPINDPSYTEIGTPRFGYRGDIRYLGRMGAGPLPNDRTHQVKVFASSGPFHGLNLGLGTLIGSGQALTAFALNTIPMGPRGSGVQTVDGLKERTPAQVFIQLHADYSIPFKEQRLTLLADVFNLLNLDGVLAYNPTFELSGHRLNPDYGTVIQVQDPRQVRLGLRFEF